MIRTVQDLLTHLTTLDATAERRFPVSASSVRVRTDLLRALIGKGVTVENLRDTAIVLKGHPFLGSGAGMRWLDRAWDQLVDQFPAPVDVAELAAHLTNDLIEANR
ncbi:MAG TPA: hypothetical protein VN803_11175 [Gemmatimonadales bacterium]|nr:hypothetical protein [Gemmatimonadales bacterium]